MEDIKEEKNGGTTKHKISLLRGYSAVMWWGTIFSFVLCVIVLASPGWSKGSLTYAGLWRACFPYPVGCIRITNPTAWLEATQAMVCLSFISSLVALAAAAVYMFMHSVSKSNIIRVFTAASVASALFMFLGVVVFASKAATSSTDLYYSFVLAVVNILFFCIVAVAGILQMSQTNVGILPGV